MISAYITLAITALLGILGIVSRTSQDEKKRSFNKLTTTGVVVLMLILASLCFGIWNQVQVDLAAEKSRAEAQETLAEIRRGQLPIEDVFVSVAFDIDFDYPALNAYKKRLDDGLNKLLPTLKRMRLGQWLDGICIKSMYGRQVTGISISPMSSLYPTEADETASLILNPYGGLHFYKDSLDFSTYPVARMFISQGKNDDPDLSMFFTPKDRISLNYDLVTKKFSFGIEKLACEKEDWHTNLKLISLLDLPNRYLFIAFIPIGAQSQKSFIPWKMTDFVLDISGSTLTIPPNQIKEESQNGLHVYSYKFPRQLDWANYNMFR